MAIRLGIFGVSTTVSFVVMIALLFFVVSSQIAAALPLLPVLGIGGLYTEGDRFEGAIGEIYPVKYDPATTNPNPYADAPADGCDVLPMMVVSLEQAEIYGAELRKDLKIPFLVDRWMTVRVSLPTNVNDGDPARINASKIKLYTTQLSSDRFIIRNILMTEGGPDRSIRSTDKWGNRSGEFFLEGGVPGENTPGLEVRNLETWVHGLTGELLTFESGDQPGPVEISVDYTTTDDLKSYYDGRLGFNFPDENPLYNESIRSVDRGTEDGGGYYRCEPPNYVEQLNN